MKSRYMFIAVALTAATGLAATPEERCQSGKNRAFGKYAACRSMAEARLALDGKADRYNTAVGKCATQLSRKWDSLEQKALNYGSSCPDTLDPAAIQTFAAACTDAVASALGGGNLPDLTLPSQPFATGQSECYNTAGDVIDCAGTGQDGELQKGAVRGYVDNLDGTITDTKTGLMWEKLALDGSIHDVHSQATWADAFLKIATLNDGAGFAGHTDWRLPNVNELATLAKLGAAIPAVDPALNNNCTGGCTVTDCSCTSSYCYWTSTTYKTLPSVAWIVNFHSGYTHLREKTDVVYVRAVRDAS